VTGHPRFGLLQTIKIDDYPFGRPMEIEAALEGYDKHRDNFWLMEAWKTASTVPTTFDGSPPELLDSDGKPQPTVKIGAMIDVPDMAAKPSARQWKKSVHGATRPCSRSARTVVTGSRKCR